MHAAMARRYRAYCGGGPASTSCVNNFWGYMQGTLNGDINKLDYWYINPSEFAKSTWAKAREIALAIMNPNEPNEFGITPEMNSCDQQACDWFTVAPGRNGDPKNPNSYYSHVRDTYKKYGYYPGSTALWPVPLSQDYFMLLTVDQKIAQCENSCVYKTTWP
jgi:hypothetical protein